MKNITVKIKDLFASIEKLENMQFEHNIVHYQKENINIQGLTTNSHVPINGLIKKTANIYEISSNNNIMRCAANHLFIGKNWEEIKACDLTKGDKIRSIDDKIIVIKDVTNLLYKDDVYDVSIDSNKHLYSTANGILHHNTSICAALAYSYELEAAFRSIIIVPDTTLTDQTKEEYEFFGLDVGEYSGTSKDLKHQHVVATWQTLKNNPAIISQFDMLICDEVQGARGPVLNDLLVNHAKNVAYRFGCTGTLPEEEADAMSVCIAIGEVQHEVPASLLIEQGHLAVPNIDIVKMQVNFKPQYEDYLEAMVEVQNDDPTAKIKTYKQFKESYFPDFTSEKSYLHTEKTRMEWIAHYIENFRLLDKGNTLVLVNGVAFGKKLTKLVPDSVFLHGKDEVAVRKEIYQSFKDNDDLIVFATINIAGTGLNIKRIFNLVLIDVGKSFIRVIQAIGRGLRKAHDKDSIYIGDVCSDLKYSKKHLAKRRQYYKEAKYPHESRTVDY